MVGEMVACECSIHVASTFVAEQESKEREPAEQTTAIARERAGSD
jgi:hypothetical protein